MKLNDLTGMRFGRLLVQELGPNRTKDGHLQWLCLCDCENTKLIKSENLSGGTTRSCGCLRSEVSSATAKITNAKQKGKRRPSVTKPGAAFRMLWYAYRKDAEHRGYSFNLTEERFREITSLPCIYCGALPRKQKVAWSGEIYTYNGIDRMYNDIGYEEGNCSPCCTQCNLFKGARDYDEFVGMISGIFSHVILGGQNPS